MKNQQKGIIVSKGEQGEDGLVELNRLLKNGWHVVRAVSMGGAGGCRSDQNNFMLAALVIVEQGGRAAGAEVELAEAEEVLEEMEGDGAPGDLLDR